MRTNESSLGLIVGFHPRFLLKQVFDLWCAASLGLAVGRPLTRAIEVDHMKVLSSLRSTTSFIATLLLFAAPTYAQKKTAETTSAPTLTRSIIRREAARLGYGGTVTLVGAPAGSITIEGWSRSDVELTAEIEVRAATEEELNQLALVNGFVFDDAANHIRILSTGTHDKRYMRRVAKNFPKHLLGLPWKIDYRLRVPEVIDLQINAGRGPITIKGVEGSLAMTATESNAELTISSGVVSVTVGAGRVNVKIPVRSWRGTGADIRLAAGDLTVELVPGFNADIDANILRLGKVIDNYGELQPRQRGGITEQMFRVRAGAGGAIFRFTVGDGTITLRKNGL